MIIRIEPREWMMQSVFLYFDDETPDAEDGAVKQYLNEHKLVPRRETTPRWEDRDWAVMYYGGCYFGRHLRVIGDMQRKALKREMLEEKLPDLLKEGPDKEAGRLVSELENESLEEAMDKLVDEYHQDSSFGPDSDGRLQVALDAGAVQERFLEILAGRSSAGVF
jgi:hypothetical protein